MKSLKTILLLGAAVLTSLCSCTSKAEKGNPPASMETKRLVCYFSATGTTANAAKRIADITGADLFEIVPVNRYTESDLDWRDSLSRSSVEMHDKNSRPAIVDSLPDMTKYDVVFIGYPNWWNTHPTIINTFIEANNLEGKTIVPFMTSGGGGIENSEKELKDSYPTIIFGEGMLMNGVSDEQIREWSSKY